MSMPILVAALMGFSVVLFFIGLGTPSAPSAEQSRLQAYGTRPRTLAEMELSMPFSERVILPVIRGMAAFINRFTPQRNVEDTKHQLELAGNPNNWTATDLLGVRGLAGILLGVVFFAVMFLRGSSPIEMVLYTAGATVLGFFLPILWLRMKIDRRKEEIQMALPDALDLLTICVESGLGFDAAMVKVAEKADNELGRAFGRCNAEIRLGKLRREALRDMSDRMEVTDMSNFIAAVIQADQLGVSLAKVLRIQSEQMRIKRRQRAEEKAAQAPVKMLFPLVFLIFPSIFIVLLGPAVLTFMSSGGLLGGG